MKKISKNFLVLILTTAVLICSVPINCAFAAKPEEPLSEIPAAEPAVTNALACTITYEGKLIILAAVIGLMILGALVVTVVHRKNKNDIETA